MRLHSDVELMELSPQDLHEVKKFCDREIGHNYFSIEDLILVLERSSKNDHVSSFLAKNSKSEIVAVRLTFAPGTWPIDLDKTTPELWQVDVQDVGYFKSMFIHKDYQGSGLGGKISNASLKILKHQGAKAVVCHCTLDSPYNSSRRYLEKLGFVPLREFPHFWSSIDYHCAHCLQRPCECTALEMILYL